MTWVAAAVVGGTVVGGLISSQGAQSAAQTQANASMNAAQIGQNEFNTITGQETPYMQTGYGALNSLDYLLGVSPQTVQGASINQPATQSIGGSVTTNPYSGALTTPMAGPPGTIANYMPKQGAQIPGYDPSSGYTIGAGGSIGRLIPGGSPGSASNVPGIAGVAANPNSTAGGYGSLLAPFNASDWKQLSPAYNFQMGQGMQGVLNGDANSAGALSGAAQKDLMGFNQNLANTSFGNAFNMYQTQQGNIYSRLAGLAQLGQSAAANTGQQGTALTGQEMQAVTNAGSAMAAGQVGSANAWSGALSSASYLPWLMQGGSAGASAGGFGMSALSGY